MENNGKYASLCDEIRHSADADGAVVMIYNGDLGNGFSANGTPEFCAALPFVLRFMADKLEADAQAKRRQLC